MIFIGERLLLLLNSGRELLVLGLLGPLEAVNRTTKAAGSETRSGLLLRFEGHKITEWAAGWPALEASEDMPERRSSVGYLAPSAVPPDPPAWPSW